MSRQKEVTYIISTRARPAGQHNDSIFTLKGSKGSGGGGLESVFTAQNMQPRVHVSPNNIIVAVAVPWPPPQHSPMLGHCASSHTVFKLNVESESATLTYFESLAAMAGVQIQK